MNFIKRAMLAVIRKKGRTFILFVIFAAIANLVLAAFAIRHASDYASVLARQKLGGKLTLRYDMQAAMEKAASENPGQRIRPQAEPITEAMVKQIAAQKNILDYNYIVSSAAIADGFKAVVTQDEQENSQSDQPGEGRMQRNFNFGGNTNYTMPDVMVTGVASSDLLDAFSNGDAKLVDGRAIDSVKDLGKNTALIEKNLADLNGLKVGSKIKLKAISGDSTAEYTVIGIYEASSNAQESGPRMGNMSFTDPYNRIYVDYKGVAPLSVQNLTNGRMMMQMNESAEFFVDDPKNIETVLSDSKKMNIDWTKFVLDANDSAYEQMMAPIESVASFSTIALYIVAIAGAIILGLILMLSIKERVYETGVLLSMGEGKFKIIAQYVAEVIVIAVVAFSLSVFSGKFIAQGVGDMLLKREVSMAEQQNTQAFGPGANIRSGQFGRLMQRRFQFGSNGDVKPIDNIDVKINTTEVGSMFGAGLLIIIAGTILPVSNIMRYKPRAILTKIN